MTKLKTNVGWNFDNSYACLPETFFTDISVSPVASPELVIINHELAASLGLDACALASEEGVTVLAGNRIPEGGIALAQAYAGHQFGHFTMLGDGRALLIGEQITPSGERYDIQLKGSGRTPYSRGGDGRATLGPMLREYIISEGMHGLGIPTTRSLAVVTTGELVMRETQLPGAILTRVAASHLRVGTFEYVARWGTKEELKILADYTIKRHFTELQDDDDKYLSLFQNVLENQASLIAQWQLVGFIHGVMNTDNMALSGETIDYGPCAFMDQYDPATVFSSIDLHGRYAYQKQPKIGAWNLARFAETLLPLLHDDQEQAVEIANDALATFSELYNSNLLTGMRAKLGLIEEDPQDEPLINELLTLMQKHEADYINTFLALTFDKLAGSSLFAAPEFKRWYGLWQKRLAREQANATSTQQLMRNNNPAVIPRNHRVEEALEAALQHEDYGPMKRLLKVLVNPYAHIAEQEEYSTPPDPSELPYRTYCGT